MRLFVRQQTASQPNGDVLHFATSLEHLGSQPGRLDHERRDVSTRTNRVWAVAASLLVTFASLLTVSAARAEEPKLDLRQLTIGATQASSPVAQFRVVGARALDPRVVIGGYTLVSDRLAKRVRQVHESNFRSTDRKYLLNVRLVETVNNHWAIFAAPDATQPTPAGFPPGTQVEKHPEQARTVVAALVRGRVLAVVTLTATNAAAAEVTGWEPILRHVTTTVSNRLPTTADLDSTTELDFSNTRIWIIVLEVALAPMLGVALAVSAGLRDIWSMERYFPGLRRAHVRFEDITPIARELRRRGRRRVGVLVAMAALVGAAVVWLKIVLDAPLIVELTFYPLALALATLAYAYRPTGKYVSDTDNSGSFPLVVGTVGAMGVTFVVSYFLLAGIGVALLMRGPGILTIAFLVFVMAVLARRALRFIARPLAFARRLVKPDVEEALAADARQEILLLRSFQDDDLRTRMHRGARHSPLELATVEPFDRFEELLAWSMWRFGPVVAIGQPTTEGHIQPLGAAREFYTDDTWEAAVHKRMLRSSMVVFVVGRSAGLYTEFVKAQQLDILGKCLFVFPPIDFVELQERLSVLEAALGLPAGTLRMVDERGRRLIGLYFDERGEPVCVGVDGRDDLAYQSLFTSVSPKLILRDKPIRPTRPSGPATPAPDIARRFVAFDPQQSYAFVPSIRFGLYYLRHSIFRRRRIVWVDSETTSA